MILTIDGPTASGKSSVARKIAYNLGYYYIYSGILYRALAYILVHHYGYDEVGLEHPLFADVQAALAKQHFIYAYDGRTQERVLYQGVDITAHLKTSSMDKMSSVVSKNIGVRDIINALQRDIATHNNVVVDGRDAGSVVFADADFKFFLTASPQVRALRWVGQQKKQGKDFSLSQAYHMLMERDMRDEQREVAPLIVPQAAIVIDNSDLDLEQTLQMIMGYIKVK